MRRPTGFSLLEMIGVMAVMAILAGALAPSVFRMLEESYQSAEATSLETLSEALEDYIKTQKSIPSSADWVAAVADYAALPPNRVELNEKNFARRIYFDPMFFTNSNSSFSGFSQTSGLSARPYSPRIIIASSLDGAVTANLNTHDRFSAVWDQVGTPLITESKTVFVERINLVSLFKRVLLSNEATSQTSFELEGGSESAVAAASGGVDGQREIYVISDTRLELNAAPYPGGTTLRQLLVRNDTSVRYQSDGVTWSWEAGS